MQSYKNKSSIAQKGDHHGIAVPQPTKFCAPFQCECCSQCSCTTLWHHTEACLSSNNPAEFLKDPGNFQGSVLVKAKWQKVQWRSLLAHNLWRQANLASARELDYTWTPFLRATTTLGGVPRCTVFLWNNNIMNIAERIWGPRGSLKWEDFASWYSWYPQMFQICQGGFLLAEIWPLSWECRLTSEMVWNHLNHVKQVWNSQNVHGKGGGSISPLIKHISGILKKGLL